MTGAGVVAGVKVVVGAGVAAAQNHETTHFACTLFTLDPHHVLVCRQGCLTHPLMSSQCALGSSSKKGL